MAALPPGGNITSPNVSPPRNSSLFVRIRTSQAKSPSTHSSVVAFATQSPYPAARSRTVLVVFTVGAVLAGALAAYVIGVSKTGLPGGALIAMPLFATVVDGRMIAGTIVPVLMVADLFALSWYHQHARWDILRRLGIWIGLGYLFGITFFVVVGARLGGLEIVIGLIVIVIVALQSWRLYRSAPQRAATVTTAATYGTTGGFTSFVANAAGPIINTYLVGLGLPKHQLIGTTAWLYFVVNLTKIPFYLALGEWSSGGRFFTGSRCCSTWRSCRRSLPGCTAAAPCSTASHNRRS